MNHPSAIVTLAELKSAIPASGSNRDSLLERCGLQGSRIVETHLDRRVVARYPTEDDDALVASVALSGSSQTLAAAGQPNAEGRVVVVTITDADRSLTSGTLTITGTVGGVVGVTETFDIASGISPLYGVKFFTAISAREITSMAGTGAGDTIKVGTSKGYEEFHTPGRSDLSKLYPCELPIQNVLSVFEDPTRAYAASTKLVEGTDYLVSKGDGLLYRLGSGNISYAGSGIPVAPWTDPARRSWVAWWRAEKVVLSAGYAGAAAVPWDIKDVVLRLAAQIFRESSGGQQGVASKNDAMGSITRLGAAALSKEMRAQLAAHRRFHTTGERDFDLEAA